MTVRKPRTATEKVAAVAAIYPALAHELGWQPPYSHEEKAALLHAATAIVMGSDTRELTGSILTPQQPTSAETTHEVD